MAMPVILTVCLSRTFFRPPIAGVCWSRSSSRRAVPWPTRSVRCAAIRGVYVRMWLRQSPGSGRLNWLLFRPFRMERTMSDASIAPIRMWLAAPMDHDVSEAIERLRRAPDVQHIAVMPDVHLGADVCIGVAVATASLIYPQAVGGDIGCGMLAIATDVEAAALATPRIAGNVLSDLGRAVPARRRNRREVIPLPDELRSHTLCKEAALEFATLGSGNHFLELQADEEGRLWLMIHSGSRALGQAVRDHHLARAQLVEGKIRALDANSDAGREYLCDADCARRYADASRRAMAEQAGRVLHARLGARLCGETLNTTDHNHVSREHHGGRELWVHRKGAMPARLGERG